MSGLHRTGDCPSRPKGSRLTGIFRSWACWLAWLLCAVSVPGCGQQLETAYGDPSGNSINGVSGFISLLKNSGRRVQIWRTLSPRMKTDFDTVILLQTDFSEIPNATAANINELMWTGDVRTFLIIARDSDCSIDYWKQVSEMPDLSAENTTAAAESLKQALFEFRKDSDRTIELKSDSFFGLAASNREDPPFEIPVKAESVDPPEIIQARWRLNRRLIKRGDAEVLWSSGDDQLLTSQPLGNGRRILVLSSAAPILNGGLVNSGNRRLAEELLKELPPGPVAISLSSRWSDEKHISSPSSLRFLKVHPHGWIFGQAMLALLMFCWWKLPIFGRPRVNVDTEDQRFGRHVEALGKLLQRTGDSTFARLAIRDWQRTGPIRAAGQSTVDGDSLNNDSDSEMSIEEEEE